MDLEKVSLLSNLKFSSFEKINENFLKAKCYVMALGKNVNRSYFDKENSLELLCNKSSRKLASFSCGKTFYTVNQDQTFDLTF